MSNENRPAKNIDSPSAKDQGNNNIDNNVPAKTSLVEKIVGNNYFLLEIYFKNTINLVKSIIIKNDNEAKLYNEYLFNLYNVTTDITDRSSWRYYRHILGLYHQVDSPIYLTSADNLTTIELTKSNIQLHKKTKEELLTFGLYYKELVDKYPEQELYIKSIITDINYNYNDIEKMEDYTILGYNKNLIEDRENSLMFELQENIDNHKVIWLIPYYSISDTLFLAAQLSIFYNFLVTSIISIRLKYAKTNKAHSFHIKNYLASHHSLDLYYDFLTTNQKLFLYKNLLYLDNHSGNNEVFSIMIDKLFTEYNISMVGYNYRQHNDLDADDYINYSFNQKLLNKKNLIYSSDNFNITDIKNKEKNLANSNEKHLNFNLDKIDHNFKNSLLNILCTKDLETIVIDQTDIVKNELIPTILDYWAYLCKEDKMNFIINFINPITNNEISLPVKDAFKLYIIALFYSNNEHITVFPVYTIKRVYRDILPTNDFIFKQFFKKKHWYESDLNTIKSYIPSYTNIITSYQFEKFLTSIYHLNIGLWLYLCNISDKDTEGQYNLMIDRLHMEDEYIFNDETVAEFLFRYNLSDLVNYDTTTLFSFSIDIMDLVYDGKLKTLSQLKYIQKAMTDIFKQFKSYSTQLVNNYYSYDIEILGLKDTRCSISEDAIFKLYMLSMSKLTIEEISMKKLKHQSDLSINTYDASSYKDNIEINLCSDQITTCKKSDKEVVKISKLNITLANNVWEANISSDADLKFLALNS